MLAQTMVYLLVTDAPKRARACDLTSSIISKVMINNSIETLRNRTTHGLEGQHVANLRRDQVDQLRSLASSSCARWC